MTGLVRRELAKHRRLLTNESFDHPASASTIRLRRRPSARRCGTSRPSRRRWVRGNVVVDQSASSVGLSMKYCRFGAVNVKADDGAANNCVATFQVEADGGSKRHAIGRISRPRPT